MIQIFEATSDWHKNKWASKKFMFLAIFPTFYSTSKPQMLDLIFDYISYLSTLSK